MNKKILLIIAGVAVLAIPVAGRSGAPTQCPSSSDIQISPNPVLVATSKESYWGGCTKDNKILFPNGKSLNIRAAGFATQSVSLPADGWATYYKYGPHGPKTSYRKVTCDLYGYVYFVLKFPIVEVNGPLKACVYDVCTSASASPPNPNVCESSPGGNMTITLKPLKSSS